MGLKAVASNTGEVNELRKEVEELKRNLEDFVQHFNRAIERTLKRVEVLEKKN